MTAPAAATVLILPGTSGNYASTPDSPDNSITGDIDLRIKLAMPDWTPASGMASLMAKYGAAGQRSWRFVVYDLGGFWGPAFALSPDGNAANEGYATAGYSFTDGTIGWLRTTWRDSDNRTQFFSSVDGSSWTQLGANVTISSAGIFNSTSVVEVGSATSGTVGMAAMTVHYAEIRNGIDGTVSNKFDPSGVTILGTRNPTSFVAPTTGETWTVNGSAWDWAAA